MKDTFLKRCKGTKAIFKPGLDKMTKRLHLVRAKIPV